MWLSNCPSTLAEETTFFFLLYIFASFVKGELTIDTWIYKESACNVEYLGLILVWEDPQEKGMVTHPVLPGDVHGQRSLLSMGSLRVGHE